MRAGARRQSRGARARARCLQVALRDGLLSCCERGVRRRRPSTSRIRLLVRIALEAARQDVALERVLGKDQQRVQL